MRVTKVFEGEREIVTYNANTLNSLVAEQESEALPRKNGSNISSWFPSLRCERYRA